MTFKDYQKIAPKSKAIQGDFRLSSIAVQIADNMVHAGSIAIISTSVFDSGKFMTEKEVYQNYIHCPSAFAFVACKQGKIGFVGYILVKIHPGQLVIAQVAVENRCRRSGIGTQLVQNVLDVGTGMSLDVICRIDETDKIAWEFFRKCGMFGSKVLPATVPGGRDEYLMSTVDPATKPKKDDS